ncbi:MAG TPA: FUSC family protein [Asticcacaulis sp.]|nr:FUSC family protein [Asticcacaulis sp.]
MKLSLPKTWTWPEGAYALRLVLAAFLAFAAARALGDERGYSAVFSAIIVTRPYQQGAIKAGFYRLLATAGGIAMAFVAVWLRRSGLNDYELLLLTLVPLSIAASYDPSYRTSLISALIMLSAPLAKVPELDVALARAGVVSLGAVIGILVSMIVLPQRHEHVAATKATRILSLLITQLKAGLAEPDFRRSETVDAKIRKALLDLSQVARDRKSGKSDEHASARIVGLTRHIQALSVLLRSQWRAASLDDEARAARSAICDQLLAFADALQAQARGRGKADAETLKPTFGAIRALDMPEQWLLETLARNLIGLSKLIG